MPPFMTASLLPSANLNHTQASTILKQVSYTSGAEVVFKGMNFEMHGLEHEVRAAVNMLLELDIVKVSIVAGYSYNSSVLTGLSEFPS